MKKFSRWVIPILLVYGLFAFQIGSTDVEITEAQNWYSANYPTPKFFGYSVIPNWNAARKVTSPNGRKYFDVPLASSPEFKFNIGNFDGQPIDTSDLTAYNGHVRLIVEKDFMRYTAYFLRVAGTKNYVQTVGQVHVLNTNFDLVQTGFTGIMEYFYMDGISADGLFFESGVPTRFVAFASPGFESPANDRCEYCYQTVTYWYVIVSTMSSTGQQQSYAYNAPPTYGINCFFTSGTGCYELPPLPTGYLPQYYPSYWSGQTPNTNNNNNNNNEPPHYNNGANCTNVVDLGKIPFDVGYQGKCYPNGFNDQVTVCTLGGEVYFNPNNTWYSGINVAIISSNVSGILHPLAPGSTNANISATATFTWTASYSPILPSGINPFTTTQSNSLMKTVTFNPICCNG